MFYDSLRPHAFQLDDPANWESTTRKLIERHLHCGEYLHEVCRALKMDFRAGGYLLYLISAQASGPIGQQHYRESTISKRFVPPLLGTDRDELRSKQIGQMIYRAAKDRPEFVRQVMSVYAAGTNRDRQIVLSCPENLDNLSDAGYRRCLGYAESLSEFVQSLGMEDLIIGLIAFDRSPQGFSRLEKLRDQLRFSGDTPLRQHAPRNPQARSSGLQIGLEVVRRTSSGEYEVDGAFFAAMVLGAAVEAWRFAVPGEDHAARTRTRAEAAEERQRRASELPPAGRFMAPFWRPSAFMEPAPVDQREKLERRRALLEKSNPGKSIHSWHLSDVWFDTSWRTKH